MQPVKDLACLCGGAGWSPWPGTVDSQELPCATGVAEKKNLIKIKHSIERLESKDEETFQDLAAKYRALKINKEKINKVEDESNGPIIKEK